MSYSQSDFLSKNNLLVDAETFTQASHRRYRGSRTVPLTIPIVAYEYEIQTNSVQDDFLKDAVCRLYDYYTKKGNKDCYTSISEDLGLSITLIKAIIKDMKQEQTDEPSDGDKSSKPVKTYKMVVLYDVIGDSFIPTVFPMERFEEMKEECEDYSKYKTSIGVSKSLKLIRTEIPRGEDHHPAMPKEEMVSALIRQSVKRFKFKKASTLLKLVFVRNCGTYNLASSLYYDKSNVVEYCAANPFNKGRASWIVNDVKIVLEKQYPGSKELKEAIEKMTESIDTDASKSSERKNNLWLDCEKELEVTYGKDKLNKYPEIKERLTRAFVTFSKMVNISQQVEASDTQMYLEESKRDYYIAVGTLIQDLLGIAFQNNYYYIHVSDYLEFVNQISEDRYCVHNYRELALKVGFDSSLISDEVQLFKDRLQFLFKNQDTEADVNSLMFGILIEAQFDENHPVYQLADKYDDFFGYLNQSVALRNPSKHGSKDFVQWNNLDLQKFAFDMFELFVLKPQPGHIFNTIKYIGHEGIVEEYQELDESANAEIQLYKHLWANEDAYNLALALEKSYTRKEAEYYSKAYNLLDEVFKQLVKIIAESNEIDKTVISKSLGDSFGKDDVARKCSAVINEYGCGYIFNNRYNIGDFINRTYSSKMTMGNRMYYFIMLANYKRPEFLRKFINENESAFKIVETVTDPDTGRGHSNVTDFKAADMESIHKSIMTLCDNIVYYVESLEEEHL